MITTTLQSLINSVGVFRKIYNMDLAASLSFKVMRLSNAIDAEMQNYEKERIRLVKKYGDESEDGNISVKEENMEIFSKEFGELVESKVELNNVDKIDILSTDIKLSAADLAMIKDFIITDEEE